MFMETPVPINDPYNGLLFITKIQNVWYCLTELTTVMDGTYKWKERTSTVDLSSCTYLIFCPSKFNFRSDDGTDLSVEV